VDAESERALGQGRGPADIGRKRALSRGIGPDASSAEAEEARQRSEQRQAPKVRWQSLGQRDRGWCNRGGK
jgi:hypothetical protein